MKTIVEIKCARIACRNKQKNFCPPFQPSGTCIRLRPVEMDSHMVKRLGVRVFSVSLLLGFFLLSGCDKDELTEPATITCTFASQSQSAMGGMLNLERIDLNIAEFDISGRRTSEGDMFFTRGFNRQTGYFPLLDDVASSTVLQIPQGSYTTLVFYTTLREEDYEFEYGNSEGEDDETGDLATYIQQARPGLLIVARYTNGGTEFPVIISLNDDIRRFAVEVMQGGTNSVVLHKDVPAAATFSLDTEYLFATITTTALENALKFPLNSEQAVVISEEYNETIYNQLAGRMQGAVALTMEDQ